MRWRWMNLVPVALVVALATGFSETRVVNLSDDAYHFRSWIGTGHAADYTEWWYFNFYDSTRNLQAIFSYLVTNPANILGSGALGFGVAQLTAVVYQNTGITTENDRYLMHSFAADYNAANVGIGESTITVLDADTYRINGSSRNGRLAWNLTYQRRASSWYAGSRVNVGVQPWELMNWLLYMPSARVQGTLTIDGTPYAVDAPGYHDHNWGEWNLLRVRWNWAQYAQPGLTFDLGDFPDKPGGIGSIEINGRRFVFTSDQYKLVHTQWAYDLQNRTYFPTQSVLNASNDVVRLSVIMDVQQSEPLSSGLPASYANLIIYEQTAGFQGQVSALDGGAVWNGNFRGNGFKEYTAAIPPSK